MVMPGMGSARGASSTRGTRNLPVCAVAGMPQRAAVRACSAALPTSSRCSGLSEMAPGMPTRPVPEQPLRQALAKSDIVGGCEATQGDDDIAVVVSPKAAAKTGFASLIAIAADARGAEVRAQGHDACSAEEEKGANDVDGCRVASERDGAPNVISASADAVSTKQDDAACCDQGSDSEEHSAGADGCHVEECGDAQKESKVDCNDGSGHVGNGCAAAFDSTVAEAAIVNSASEGGASSCTGGVAEMSLYKCEHCSRCYNEEEYYDRETVCECNHMIVVETTPVPRSNALVPSSQAPPPKKRARASGKAADALTSPSIGNAVSQSDEVPQTTMPHSDEKLAAPTLHSDDTPQAGDSSYNTPLLYQCDHCDRRYDEAEYQRRETICECNHMIVMAGMPLPAVTSPDVPRAEPALKRVRFASKRAAATGALAEVLEAPAPVDALLEPAACKRKHVAQKLDVKPVAAAAVPAEELLNSGKSGNAEPAAKAAKCSRTPHRPEVSETARASGAPADVPADVVADVAAPVASEPAKMKRPPRAVTKVLAMKPRERSQYLRTLSAAQQLKLGIQMSMAEASL